MIRLLVDAIEKHYSGTPERTMHYDVKGHHCLRIYPRTVACVVNVIYAYAESDGMFRIETSTVNPDNNSSFYLDDVRVSADTTVGAIHLLFDALRPERVKAAYNAHFRAERE